MESNVDYFKDKKILITGGGGYLGSKLAETLAQYDARLFLLDVRFNDLAERLIKSNSNVEKCSADITNRSDMEKACENIRPELVFHFCALLTRERGFGQYDNLYEVNARGTLNLLESLRATDYKGFYYSSTSEVYGTKNPAPFDEQQLPAPASPYSLTKLMAENLIQTYSDVYRKPYTILRIFNFFGLGMSEGFFINQLIATLNRNEPFLMTGGEQVRDFLHIDELLGAIISISKTKKSNGEIINICSGRKLMLKELASNIAGKYHKEHLLEIGAIPYRKNEVWEMIGSNKKMNLFHLAEPKDVVSEILNSLIE